MDLHRKPIPFGVYQVKRFLKYIKAFVIVSCSLMQLSTTSFASELKVYDCEGNLRASTELQDGETKGVRLSLTEAEANSKAKFSKAAGDAVLELRARDKSLFFGSVESGDWKICKEDGQNLAFNSVEFIEGDSETLRVASLTAAGVAVASGIAIASSDPNEDSNGAPSPSMEPSAPDRNVTELSAKIQPGNTSRPADAIIVSSRCGVRKPSKLAAIGDDCREEEAAPIISPYD